MFMAKHWQMLLVPGFSDYSWAECDVDRGRRRIQGMRWSVLICVWRDIFEPFMSPLVFENLDGILCSQEHPLQINEILYIHHVQR